MVKKAVETPFGKEGFDRILRQADEFWWAPEIARRKAMGTLADNFAILMAQALFCSDGSVVVRFNEEVRGIANVRASRPIEKGDQVYRTDLDGLESFDLLEEDLDCGHFTMIKVTSGWFVTFNFLRSRSLCASLLDSAKEFLDVVRFSIEKGKLRPAVDNLYSACELVSKAQLIMSSMLDRNSKSHRAIRGKINKWRKLGNINERFVTLFNELGDLRPSYRYEGASTNPAVLSQKEISLVEDEIARLEDMCLQLGPGESEQAEATGRLRQKY